MKKAIIPAILALLVAGFSVVVVAQKAPPVPTKGAAFQDFKLAGLDGVEKGLVERYKGQGKIIVLNLFATWCPPCRGEIPGFVSLQKKYAKQVIFVGVSFDRFKDSGPLKQFAKEMGMSYDVLVGSPQLAQYVQLRGIPRTFLLMPDFTVIEDITGGYPEEEFEPFLTDAISRLPKGK
jgi:thiol-disulfide isomerase/thioredoxin